MKRRDEIIHAAFEGGAESLRPRLDRAGKKELDGLIDIKSALKSLADVPECQLSNEHLRNAVLNRPSVPTRPRTYWLATPLVMAAGLAAVFFLSRPQPATNSPVAERSGTSVPATLPIESVPQKGSAEEHVAVKVRDNVPAPSVVAAQAASTTRPVRRHHAASKAPKIDSGLVVRLADSNTFDGAHEAANRSTASDVAATESYKDVAASESLPTAGGAVESAPEPVVVITRDTGNGASEAQEVKAPSNVVFGG